MVGFLSYKMFGFIYFFLIFHAKKQNKLFGKEEADGILYTEYCVENNKTANVKYPTVLVPEFVRAAHMYNVTFGHVRDSYYMAGLLSHIQVKIADFDKSQHIQPKSNFNVIPEKFPF